MQKVIDKKSVKTKEKKYLSKELKQNIGICLTMFLLLMVVLFSFYPGILTTDGNNQWEQVITNNITNNHPFFSTFFWWVLAQVWAKPTCLIVFQIALLSVIWTYICSTLRKDNNCYIKQILYTIIMCFIPIIFMYTVTAWKDIIYSYMLLLLSLMFYIGIKKDFKYSYINLFIINICLVWIMNYRYNGIIAVGLSIITFLIIFIIKKIGWKKILIFIGMFISIFLVCKIPEKIMLKPIVNSSSNDIMLWITASLVKDNKIDNLEDLAILNEIYPIEKMKEEYNPYVVNPMSFSKYYNRDIYEKYNKNVKEILIKYSLKHPLTIVKHYLKSDNLLIGLKFRDGYVYIFDFDYWETKYSGNFDVKTQPIFKTGYKFYLYIINTSTKLKVLNHFYLPAYPLYLSIIGIIIYARKRKDKRYFLAILPMIYNTISLAPINVAQDLRYAYINYLTLLLFVIPLFLFTKKQKYKVDERINDLPKNPKTLVIIPAYNESGSIEKVVNNVYSQNIENLDVVVVNDGSTDNTLEKASNTKAIVLDLSSNLGIGGAVQAGYLYAYKNNYDIAIQIDGDGQHNPLYINKMIKIMKDEHINMVIGSRFVEKTSYKQTFMRMLGININGVIIKMFTGKKIYDTTSGYRAVDKTIIEKFVQTYPYDYPEPITNMQMILQGKTIKEIPVEMNQRTTGVSSISPLKSINYMVKVILSLFINGFRENYK